MVLLKATKTNEIYFQCTFFEKYPRRPDGGDEYSMNQKRSKRFIIFSAKIKLIFY